MSSYSHIVSLVVLLWFAFLVLPGKAPGDYEFTDLGTLGVGAADSQSLGINSRDMIVGSSEWDRGRGWRGWCVWFRPGHLEPIADLSDQIIEYYRERGFEFDLTHGDVVARDIAITGGGRAWVIGTIEVSRDGARQTRSWLGLWQPFSGSHVGVVTAIRDLGELAGGSRRVEVSGINDGNRIVGKALDSGGTERAVWAYGNLGRTTEVQRLSAGAAADRSYAISNDEWIAGSFGTPAAPQASYWESTGVDTWSRHLLPFVSESYSDSGLIDSESEALGIETVCFGPIDDQVLVGYSGVGMSRRPVYWVHCPEHDRAIDGFLALDPFLYSAPTYQEWGERMPESGTLLDVNARGLAVGWARRIDGRRAMLAWLVSCDEPDDGPEVEFCMEAEFCIIQDAHRVVWAHAPDRLISDDGWTLRTANAINDDGTIIGFATKRLEWGPLVMHAYLLRPIGVESKAVKSPPSTSLRYHAKYGSVDIGTDYRRIVCGPTFDLGIKTGRSPDVMPSAVAREDLPATYLRVLTGSGAVIDELVRPDFKDHVFLLVAGKAGDWAVGYWGGSLRLAGDYKSVGAQQGFDARYSMVVSYQGTKHRPKPIMGKAYHKYRIFTYGDTRADGGIFVDHQDRLFVFGKDNGTGEHSLPAALREVRVSDVAAGDRFNCIVKQGNGELVAWGNDSGRAIRDIAKTGLFANGQSGIPVSDVAATSHGIVALDQKGKLHVFGRADGAKPGRPVVLDRAALALKRKSRFVEVKGVPGTNSWAVRDSDGYVHLRRLQVGGKNTFYAPHGFYVAYGGNEIFTAAPRDTEVHKADGSLFKQSCASDQEASKHRKRVPAR
ncbi:MAG: hypothetical protein H8E44_46890 [Planctomycetes bacterium]|nr:hypothetical protein [Planctomycetota bacterium]MBL7042143.1 hypothetical protein [Pirellulaceae bacterium]